MRSFIVIALLFMPGKSFSQDKPDSLCLLKRQLYTGTRMAGGKQLVSGFYLTQTDPGTFALELDVLEDWVKKDSLRSILRHEASYVCGRVLYNGDEKSQKTTCHAFISPEGLLLTLSFQGGIEVSGCKVPVLAEIAFPPQRKNYTDVLPVMYFK